MITIKNKVDCCGCYACANICPKQCIELKADEEGFRYPEVDESRCIECHLCEKVCPISNQHQGETEGVSVYGAVNKDKRILHASTSGGVFYELGKEMIENYQGVVFGVRYDEQLNAVTDYATDIQKLELFLGSKYVQAKVNNAYQQVKEFLNQGRYVLYSGTPCQIAGLKSYLGKEHDKLYTCDFICEGVPSDWLLDIYKKYYEKKYKSKIVDIKFRHKRFGWRYFGFLLTFANKKKLYIPRAEISYMYFLFNFSYMRPSCYECRFRELNSGSDFKLADFWEVQNSKHSRYNFDGVSHLVVNGKKAKLFFSKLKEKFLLYESSVDEMKELNHTFNTNKYDMSKKEKFKTEIQGKEEEDIYFVMEQYLNLSRSDKIKNRIKLPLVKLKYKFLRTNKSRR